MAYLLENVDPELVEANRGHCHVNEKWAEFAGQP